MTTKVVNISNLQGLKWRDNPNYVYIGRENEQCKLTESIFRNPYPSSTWGHVEATAMFAEFFHQNEEMQHQATKQLTDKTLVCWCHPEQCHGDILASYVNEQANLTKEPHVPFQ